MDTENTSAPARPQSRVAAKNHPIRDLESETEAGTETGGGLIHDHTRHTTRFTVIGNHLAQHRELSLLAIGLATHIQSLPPRAAVDIKPLTARFTEGATRIVAALRELETHGYLRRERKRISGGRVVTRTISCNQPKPAPAPHTPAPPTARPTPSPSPTARPEKRHRLTALLPPTPPREPSAPPPVTRHPLQTCDGCDRAFRAPAPGRCRDCRCDLLEAA